MSSGDLVGAVRQASALLVPFVAQPADRSLAADTTLVLGEIVALEEQVRIIRVKHQASFDAENLGIIEGVPNAAVFVALAAGIAVREARKDSALGRRLFHGDLAATGEALTQGQSTLGQARAIHHSTTRMLAADVAKLEPILLGNPALAPEHIETLAGHAKAMIAAASDQAEEFDRQQAERTVGVHRIAFGGGWSLGGHLDEETGALFQALLAEGSHPQPEADGARDQRSLGQRQHDALTALLKGAVAADPHNPAIPSALVTLTISTEELRAMQAPAQEQPAPVQDLSQQCCDADLTWMVIDQPADDAPRTGDEYTDAVIRAALAQIAPAFGGIKTDVLALGRIRRLASWAQRRALARRDGGCVWPGCHAPPARCRAHHLRWWDQHHGPTDLDNLSLVRLSHESRAARVFEVARERITRGRERAWGGPGSVVVDASVGAGLAA